MPKRKNGEKSDEKNKDDFDRSVENSVANSRPETNEEDFMEIESVAAEATPRSTDNNLKDSSKISEKIDLIDSKIKNLEDQLEKEKKEQLYIRAEFDTYRRRAIKERSDTLKYAGERVFVSLLDIVDNFERALSTEVNSENFKSFQDGVKLIADELKNTLKRAGVEAVEPKDNKYDPLTFEAISSEETDKQQPGEITRVFRKAYRLYDRVIRPGQVAVAKPISKKNDDGTRDSSDSDEG